MENWEMKYRAAMRWNRFWLAIVATITVVGATGLVVRFARGRMFQGNGVVTTQYTPNGDLRVQIPEGVNAVAVLQSTVNGKIVTADFHSFDAKATMSGMYFGPKEITIPAKRLQGVAWQYATGNYTSAPKPGTPIYAIYLPIQTSQWLGTAK